MDMPFLKLVLSYFVLLTIFNVASSEVDIPIYYDHNCTINNNFISNSRYQFNLEYLLYRLYSNATASDAKFYNTTTVRDTTADDTDSVYGEYMCRGDVPLEVCQNCVEDAINRITSECPYNREAIIWYDQCSVRYSDRYFFSTLRPEPTDNRISQYHSTKNCPDPGPDRGTHILDVVSSSPRCRRAASSEDTSSESEYEEVNGILNEVVAEAATATKKFATKEANLTSDGLLVSSLVQCTPDLSQKLCSKCLYGLIKLIPSNATYIRGRILNPSCNLRVEGYQFYYKGNQPPGRDYFTEGIGRPSLIYPNCTTENITSKYQNNLRSLILKLNMSSNITTNNGFYSTIIGNKSDNDTIYGLFMCRGDVSVELCHECVNEGLNQLNYSCSSSKEAIIWYDMCMLRYSNRSFTLDTKPVRLLPGTDLLQNQSNGFSVLLASSLDELLVETLNSVQGVRNFGTMKKPSSSDLTTLYALAQCTPNLNRQDCQNCLDGALGDIKECCLGKKGGHAMNPSCNMRFETYRFYGNKSAIVLEPPANPKPPKVLGNTGKQNYHSRTIMIVVSATLVSIMLLCLGYYFWRLRKKSKSYKNILKKNFGSEGATLELLQFNLATIEVATDKFSIENRLGKGGFGEVYMGILSDGRKIAVKRLSEKSRQGLLEFKNEVLLIAKLQHRNLVALLGFCLKDEEKILVYEYVPNKSLDYFLFGSQRARVLNWPERYKIVEGVARGVLYLHEHSRLKIIHRDLKPSNILLDDEMNPKISDFGMAKMVGINEDIRSTNRIVGTLGYMAPEYVYRGCFSEKSDVYSFGVIVLEIIGEKSINAQSESHESQYAGGLLSEAWHHWRDEELTEILGSNLTKAYDGSHSEIMRCIHIGLLCVQVNPHTRPSMSEVVKYLSNDYMEMPIPQEPVATSSAIMEVQHIDDNHNVQCSINEISDTISIPR